MQMQKQKNEEYYNDEWQSRYVAWCREIDKDYTKAPRDYDTLYKTIAANEPDPCLWKDGCTKSLAAIIRDMSGRLNFVGAIAFRLGLDTRLVNPVFANKIIEYLVAQEFLKTDPRPERLRPKKEEK